MTPSDLTLLRRKEVVGTVAALAWGLFCLFLILGLDEPGALYPITLLTAWLFEACWVALDARFRDAPVFSWTAFTVVAGPVGLLFYFISRPPAPAFCTFCGASVPALSQTCANCGQQASLVYRIFSGFRESLSAGPPERARHTVKYMAFALGAFVVFGMAFGEVLHMPRELGILAISAYWVLVPWWVHLDAMWRRMDAVPWALLTLLTNVFGLATYLVVRYPDPRTCPQCGAGLTPTLRHCPYCGSEAELVCPRCQSPVSPDWAYCSACAAQLPATPVAAPAEGRSQSDTAPSLSIRGTVSDALTRSPIARAQVKIDSKTAAQVTTTDPLGRFGLAGLEPRPYVLLASAEGYIQEAKPYTPSAVAPAQVHFALYPDIPGEGSGNPEKVGGEAPAA